MSDQQPFSMQISVNHSATPAEVYVAAADFVRDNERFPTREELLRHLSKCLKDLGAIFVDIIDVPNSIRMDAKAYVNMHMPDLVGMPEGGRQDQHFEVAVRFEKGATLIVPVKAGSKEEAYRIVADAAEGKRLDMGAMLETAWVYDGIEHVRRIE